MRSTLAIFLGAGALVMTAAEPAAALQIEITGGGADRLERQRSWGRGDLPLAGTPDLGKLPERLGETGLREGAAVFLRIFKAESELELWMMKGKDYKLFATYPICQWSGVLGPKFYEGDNQSPEGFYTVGRRDLKWQTRHHRAFNIGFPNAFDKLHGRTGSNILVHGGCSTEGCFAMTNPVIDEVFRLANAAVASGQKEIHVHVFPFRMTADNLMQHSASPWLDFWINLKTGYDLFAETRLPPSTGVCKSRYVFDRVPEFGAVEPERDCDPPAATGSGAAGGAVGGSNIVTTGSLRATAASTLAAPGAALGAAPGLKQTPMAKPAEDRRRVRRANRSRSRDGLSPEANPREDTSEPPATGNPMGTHLLPGAAPLRPTVRQSAVRPALPAIAVASPFSTTSRPVASEAAPQPATATAVVEPATFACDIARATCHKWAAIQARREVARATENQVAQRRADQIKARLPQVADNGGWRSASNSTR